VNNGTQARIATRDGITAERGNKKTCMARAYRLDNEDEGENRVCFPSLYLSGKSIH